MLKILRKTVAIILVLTMLLSANATVFATIVPPESGYETLSYDGSLAYISEGGELDWFEFIPETDGRYVFYSDTYYSYTRGYLFDSSFNQIAQSVDDSDFEIAHDLIAGEKYYLATGLQDSSTATYYVCVRLSPIQSIGFDNITFYETDGYAHTDNEGNEYTRYAWWNYLSYTVGMNNGDTVYNESYEFYYDGRWYEFKYEDPQSFENQWTVGNTYTVYLSVDGYTSTVDVSIKETPVLSVDFEPVEIIENTNGYISCNYDPETNEPIEEYYRYNWTDGGFDYTVYFKDGTSVKGDRWGFEYEGEYHSLSYREVDEQTYETPWTLGNTYNVKAYILGYEATVPISIVESPVVSVEFLDNEYIENYDGNWSSEYNEETDEYDLKYFQYDWYYNFPYRITLKNGDVIEGDDFWFEYNNKTYYFTRDGSQYFSGDQSYENPWTLGEYTIPLEVMGYETEYTLKIVETPVESITVEPISFMENIGGYTGYSWDDELETDVEYYYYPWWEKISYTVTFKNGDTIEANGGFEYNGKWVSMNYDSVQNHKNEWTVGNTYSQPISILGYDTNVSVEITDTPIESIVVDPVSVTENMDGYTHYDYNEETETSDLAYHCYYWWDKLNYTVTMKNGDVVQGEGRYFEYDGYDYEIDREDTQSYATPWKGGNTYNASFSLLGKKADVSVTVELSPVERFELDPVTIIEGTKGSINSGFNPETQQFDLHYYSYYWWNQVSGTVYMRNGDIYTIDDGGVLTGDGYEGIGFSDDQSYQNQWKAGNTYTRTITFMGVKADVNITITESPVVSITAEPITLIYGKDADHNYEYNPDTGSWDLVYNHYYWQNRLSYTINFNDGTSIQCSGSGFYYNGDWYNVNISSPEQNYYNQWTPGNVYTATITALGKSTNVSISINNEFTDGNYTYIVQGGSAFITECNTTAKTVTLPTTLGGYPVVGIIRMGSSAEEIIIPDCITSLSNEMLYNSYNLKKLTIGAGVSYLNNEMFAYSGNLEQIAVSKNNQYYSAVDGILYDKAVKKMIAIPRKKTTTHTVPDTVTDIDIYFNSSHNFTIELGNSKTGYVKEDGIIYDKDKTVIYFCDSNKTGEYVMPDTVEKITNMAFNNSKLTKVTVSENVTSIVYYAFAGSVNLEKVVLPNTVASIGNSAFRDCTKLTNINIPTKLKVIEEHAFDNCGIKSAVIPGTARVDYAAFLNSNLETVTLTEGITYIGSCAFKDTKLKKVTLPNSLKSMGSYVFEGSPLEELTIGAGLYSISENAFAGTKLTSVVIPENIQYVGSYAFANSTLKNVDFKNEEIAIGEGAFYRCPLKELVLHEGMTQIESYAFYGIDAEEVDIPETVTMIAYKSFENSKNLLTIDISDNVESLCGYAFHGTAWYDAQEDGVVYLEDSLYSYKGDMPESTEIVVKDGTKLIADYAFEDDFYLKKVTIPASVEYIGSDAFGGCLNLEEIVVAEDNENFYFEDGVLYDEYDCVVWAKPVEIEVFRNYKTEFKYGEKFNFGGDAELRVMTADGDTIRFWDNWSNWFKEAPTKFVTGYNAYQPGTQTVTVAIGPFERSYEVTVAELTVTGVGLNKNTLNLTTGSTETLVATVTPENAPDKSVTWKSSDKSVATVNSNGKVTAKAVGTAVISVITNVGEFEAACQVTVTCAHKNTTKVAAKASTCKVKGNKAYTKCDDCDTVISGSDAKLALAAHKYKTTTTKATLSKNGKVVKKCSVCSKSTTTVVYYPKTIKLSTTSYTYDGKVKTPSITVKDSAGKTISSSNYSVSYESGRKNAGTYDVKLTFKGNYSGSKTLSFKINPVSYSKCSFKLSATGYTYDGKVKSPSVVVKNASGTTLKKNTHYTVTYATGRKNVGTYKVTIKMKGNYTGTKTLTFKINPAKTTVSKVTAAKKSLKVYVTKKTSQVTGYQIQYSTSKSFKSYSTKNITSYKTTSTTLKSLKAKTTYYVRVRTYKTVGKTKYYSGWSTVKTQKTK